MRAKSPAIASAILAAFVVVIVLVGGAAFYTGTLERTTVTAAPVTSTQVSTSTVTSTATVTGPTTTLTTTQTATLTAVNTTQSSSCQTTTTTSSTVSVANASIGVQMVDLAKTFSSISLVFGENSTNGPLLINDSYSVVYASATTYKMTFSESVQGFNQALTAWMVSNGTVLATESSGQNTTGVSAELNLDLMAAPFSLIVTIDQGPENFIPSAQIQATGNASVTLGTVTVPVTNYGATSLPVTFCQSGVSYSLDTYIVQYGVVPSTNFTLVTYLDLQGTQNAGGASSSYSVYLKIFTITLA